MKPAKTKIRTYALWTYDVWGNARDGWDVNDRYSHGTVTIACKRAIFNAGRPREFSTYEPTDRQLSRAAGFIGAAWDGEPGGEHNGRAYGGIYHAENPRNGRPIGELCEEVD